MAIFASACMLAVATTYHLPPRVLPSIQAVESGYAGAVRDDANGSQDLGIMQVNTRWVEPLARYTGLAPVTVRARLIFDPCFNIAAAGAILRGYLDETRGDLMAAIGYYHSHTLPLGAAYRLKVVAAAERLFSWPANRYAVR